MYTQEQIERGVGCYSDRPTYLWADAQGRIYTSDGKAPPVAGVYFCGRKDPVHAPGWC